MALELLPGIAVAGPLTLIGTLSAFVGTTATVAAMLLLLCFAVGACLGSFANACAMRLVRDEDFIHGKSRCRACERTLQWHENLPIIGFLMLRGRCGCRKSVLSRRYLIVELSLATIAVLYAVVMPPAMAIGFMFAAVMATIALLTDLESMVLHPALLTITGTTGVAWAGIGASGLIFWPLGLFEALAGALIGALAPLSINSIYRLLRHQNGFGEGDFWLLGAIGAWSGPVGAISIFLFAAMLGATVGIIMIAKDKASGTTKLPFGLFISVVFILCPYPNILLF